MNRKGNENNSFLDGIFHRANIGDDEKATEVGRHGTVVHDCTECVYDTTNSEKRQTHEEKINERMVQSTLGAEASGGTGIREVHGRE